MVISVIAMIAQAAGANLMGPLLLSMDVNPVVI
jgi:hypothetical protein